MPNLSALPTIPAATNSRKSILPAPAIQARALYGIGETAAMNIPAEPYLSTSTFNLAIVD